MTGVTRFRTGHTNAMGLDPAKRRNFVEIELGEFVIVNEFPKDKKALAELIAKETYGEKTVMGKAYRIRFVERAFRLGLVWDWKDIDPQDVWVLQPILDKINRNLESIKKEN